MPQPEEGIDLRREDHRRRPRARPRRSRRRVAPGPRAVAAHRRVGDLHGRRVTIWRARLEDGVFVPVEVQPEGRAPDGLRRVHPRGAVTRPPAGRRSPSCGACSRTAHTPTGRWPRPAPISTRATGRSRSASPTGRCSASARSTTASTPGQPRRRRARPAGAGGAADRGLRGRLERGARPRGRERRGRARPRRGPRPCHRVHERRRAPARRGLPPPGRGAAAGPLAESYPDWIHATWVRDWGEEEALELMRAQNEPGELVVRSADADRRADGRARRLPHRARRRRPAERR